jgi:hypothetical protein
MFLGIGFGAIGLFSASFWYCFHFGFERFAQRRSECTHETAIRKGQVERSIG